MVDDFSDRSSTIEKFVKEIFVLDAPPIRSMKKKKKKERREMDKKASLWDGEKLGMLNNRYRRNR